MKNRDYIGTILGAGIITAGAVATATAVSRTEKSARDPLETGIIPGYSTMPGEEYEVYRQIGEDAYQLMATLPGIWFDRPVDWFKYIYDHLRPHGLTVRGALIGLGHARKAGVHARGKRAPMRGYNNWGVKAGLEWREAGNLFWVGSTGEIEDGELVLVPAAKWRFYFTMTDAVKNWLAIMRSNYPVAYRELYVKQPDIDAYIYGLQHGVDGKSYATGASDMGDIIDATLEEAPEQLNEAFGYNIS